MESVYKEKRIWELYLWIKKYVGSVYKEKVYVKCI